MYGLRGYVPSYRRDLDYHSVRMTNPAGYRTEVMILLFHAVSNPTFANQLDWLLANHFVTITPDDLYYWLRGERGLPERPLLITFDDGGASNYTVAYPELLSRNMKATIYVVSGWLDDEIGSTGFTETTHMTWAQVREVVASGLITIGNHTRTHGDLKTRTVQQITDEITYARNRIEAETGHPCLHVAYPFGGYNSDVLTVMNSLGMRTGRTVLRGGYGDSTRGVYAFTTIATPRYELVCQYINTASVLIPIPYRAPGLEILPDSSFDTGYAGWTLQTGWARVLEGEGGTYCLKGTSDLDGTTRMANDSQYRRVTPDATYCLTARVKYSVGATGSVKIVCVEISASGTYLRAITAWIKPAGTSGDWQTIRYTYRPSADAFRVQIGAQTDSTVATLWIKNISLIEGEHYIP